jgi:hypothetical protein
VGVVLSLPPAWVLRAGCDECELPGHKLSLGAVSLGGFVSRFVPPSLPGVRGTELPSEPIVFDVTVGRDGVPCRILLARPAAATLSGPIMASISKWKFMTPFVEGRPVCFAARLMVYVRKRGSRIEVVVPGLGDVEKR